jgi:hypothetical protein
VRSIVLSAIMNYWNDSWPDPFDVALPQWPRFESYRYAEPGTLSPCYFRCCDLELELNLITVGAMLNAGEQFDRQPQGI